jgi:hypothetical protein
MSSGILARDTERCEHMNLSLWANCLQRQLFPALEEELGPLSDSEHKFVRVVELVDLSRLIKPYAWKLIGRKPASRLALAKAFIAKMIWNLPTTEALIDLLKSSPTLRRLCGWDARQLIPDRSTFSRAFEAFALGQLPQRAHEALIQQYGATRLVGHSSHDATAIEAREKPQKKTPPPPQPKAQRGRPPRDTPPTPKEPRRLEVQPLRTLAENLADLPIACDVGCKRNSQGYQESWIGYKLHLTSIDGDIPVSAILTSASTHDSQVAIPLFQMTRERIPLCLYDLLDSAYDAPEIHRFSRDLGHVPLIDPNPRRSPKPRRLDPAERRRFAERSTSERVNSNLKDNYGGKFVRVRGAAKVMCHLMFGLLALTAVQLFHLLV